MFWRFDSGILPSGHTLVETLSTTGDVCHRDIKNVSAKVAKNFFIKHDISEFEQCSDGRTVPLTIEQAEKDKAAYDKEQIGG